MSHDNRLIIIYVFEGNLSSAQKAEIWLPAVPRPGESLTLEDGHYVIDEVFWQVKKLGEPPKGHYWPDYMYYTIRMTVHKKFEEN